MEELTIFKFTKSILQDENRNNILLCGNFCLYQAWVRHGSLLRCESTFFLLTVNQIIFFGCNIFKLLGISAKLSYTFNCLVYFSHQSFLIFSNLVLLFVVWTTGTTANEQLRFSCRNGNKTSFSTSEAAVKPAKSISEKWNYFLPASISLT